MGYSTVSFIKIAKREFSLFITFSDVRTMCTIVHGLGPNFMKNVKERILNFYFIF